MFEQAFKNIDADLRNEAGCTTELDYTEQTSWLLFLKYLDGLEQDKAMEAERDGRKYAFILDESYRWSSWAAPKDNRADVHHVYPRQYLKDQNLTKGTYNQIANYVVAQSEIDIAIGAKAPASYFKEPAEQCNGGAKKYGGITDKAEMAANLTMNCIPAAMQEEEVKDFGAFLEERRKLVALKIKSWFEVL